MIFDLFPVKCTLFLTKTCGFMYFINDDLPLKNQRIFPNHLPFSVKKTLKLEFLDGNSKM